MGRSFATDLRQRVINSSLEAAEEARSDHPCQRELSVWLLNIYEQVISLARMQETCHKLAKCSAYTVVPYWQVNRWPCYSVNNVYYAHYYRFLSGCKVNSLQFIGYPVRYFCE